MHLDPQIAIAAVTTLGAGWLMIAAGLQKSALEQRRRRRVCPSCGREIHARVCSSCAG
jgi:ribosomal protein L37AE/L43A